MKNRLTWFVQVVFRKPVSPKEIKEAELGLDRKIISNGRPTIQVIIMGRPHDKKNPRGIPTKEDQMHSPAARPNTTEESQTHHENEPRGAYEKCRGAHASIRLDSLILRTLCTFELPKALTSMRAEAFIFIIKTTLGFRAVFF